MVSGVLCESKEITKESEQTNAISREEDRVSKKRNGIWPKGDGASELVQGVQVRRERERKRANKRKKISCKRMETVVSGVRCECKREHERKRENKHNMVGWGQSERSNKYNASRGGGERW